MNVHWSWLLLVGIPVGVRAQTAVPCPRSDSAFVLVPTDTVRGFRLPFPRVTALPPREFHGRGEVHLLVTPEGNVMRDSTKVLGASSREDSLLLAGSVAGFRFQAARYFSCGISAWFVIRVRRD